MIFSIVLLVVLIVINGLFSATEVALITVNTNKIKVLADNGDKNATNLNSFLENITKVLATIQVGITLAGFFSSAYAANGFADDFSNWFLTLGTKINYDLLYNISIVIITLILTYFMLVFGELIPKRVGIRYAESIAYRAIAPMRILGFISSPFVFILTASANTIVRMFGINPESMDTNITEEEIRMMIDAGGDNGSIDENEKEMINNIFEFDSTSAGDIATHRTDIVALPLDASIEEIKEVLNDKINSRIPVYNENIDDIVGIFHVKDMISYVLNNGKTSFDENFNLKDILMEPYFVPFSKKTDELFEEMQKEKVHMAIVIDEYGGTAGIVTMEDILEEIVGNIFDEYDTEEEEEIRVIDESTFSMQGTTSLDDVEEFLNIEFENHDDYDTLGGYLIGILDRIPDDGEHPDVIVNGYMFKIKNIEDKRIENIFVSRIDSNKS